MPRRSIEDAETSLPSLLREFVVRGPVEAACVELPRKLLGLFGACAVFGAVVAPAVAPLLLSMCVRISLVYFKRLVISWLLLSRAKLRGMIDLSPLLFTYVTRRFSELRRISVWS